MDSNVASSSVLSSESSKVQAHRALTDAIRKLSKGQSTPIAQAPNELVSNLVEKDPSSLSVEEMESLARVYYTGSSELSQSYEKAVELWKVASEKGSIESKYCYAQCLIDGKGVETNCEKALELMLDLSENHDYCYAHYAVAKLYESGQGTPKDDVKAFRYYQKASLGGIPQALYNIGNAYAEGKGVGQDLKRAIAFFEAAVEVEDPYACFTLGQWYYHGKGGLTPDKSKAFELQQKAANKGHPFAMFNVGTALLTGDGVTLNHTLAEEWLRKAHDANVVYASLNLAKMYMDGVGVKKDLAEAKSICLKVIGKIPVANELLAEIESRLS